VNGDTGCWDWGTLLVGQQYSSFIEYFDQSMKNHENTLVSSFISFLDVLLIICTVSTSLNIEKTWDFVCYVLL